MIKITDENYDIYKKTFETIWIFEATKVINIDPNVEYSPVNVLNNWQLQSKTLAKRGLKEGLRDTLTILQDLPNDLKKELNELLLEKKLPGFYSLMSTIKNTLQKVLKAGKIKNLDEYYIIKELLVDISSGLSTSERKRLALILSDFENSYGKTQRPS